MKITSPHRSAASRVQKHDTVSRTLPLGNQDLRQRVEFIWGAGIECSFIPHLGVDQFEWTQHNVMWKKDFELAKKQLGVSSLRYTLPWHEIEIERGRFDWRLADERVKTASAMGLDLFLDVMHFGTPLWLKQAVGDPEFPEALERYTEALVTRYRSVIHTWCPCNEPLVLALFSGDFGFWPPHSRHWKGYMPVLSRIVQAVNRSIRAIRRVDPNASVLYCDAVENYKTRVDDLQNEVEQRNQRRFLAMDLLLGRVDSKHALAKWLTSNGMSELDLEWFRTHPQSPDILGLDFYPHSEWQLDRQPEGVRQRRTESPIGLFGIAQKYYSRYGLPMMLTETSIDGQAINREIWLEKTVDDCRRLREDGVPMLGYFWWPMLDQVDWDGALTHRIGKIHEVGLFHLKRTSEGVLTREATPLVKQFSDIIKRGDESVGPLGEIAIPCLIEDEETNEAATTEFVQTSSPNKKTNGKQNGNGNGVHKNDVTSIVRAKPDNGKETDVYGIVVFSHLRWGFVWQRPQQFLSRFAKKHRILFIEEPFFDLSEDAAPRLDLHQVMPNVTVASPHLPPSWNRNEKTPAQLREFAREAIEAVNDAGEFDRPLHWYYSPMDSSWSLGYFDRRGIVYDCMDELSQFTGAPAALIANEARLMKYADVVFAGGLALGEKKKKQHDNVHAFGCGVDIDHFGKAMDEQTTIPPDIDFVGRPVLGWFGVVDERVDYGLVGDMARMRPGWSFVMVGPVVKVDPNTLPHFPNLFWIGSRDYQQLPNYCKAFDVNMMCFAINRATEFINPTKGLEYMATGRPIVSTPVRDVVQQWTDVVRIASTSAEFIRAAEEALAARGNDDRVTRGLELARTKSWEATVDQMQSLIAAATKNENRPSQQKIEPLNQADMDVVYAATQGS